MLTYMEAVRAYMGKKTVTIESGVHKGTTGSATAIVVLFGEDHLKIDTIYGLLSIPIQHVSVQEDGDFAIKERVAKAIAKSQERNWDSLSPVSRANLIVDAEAAIKAYLEGNQDG